jgi:ubiquinone biosynthesis protein
MSRFGVRLDDDTVRRLASENARSSRWRTLALWVAAAALTTIAIGHFI